MSSFLSEVNKQAQWLPFFGFVLLQNSTLKCHRKLWSSKQSILLCAKSYFIRIHLLLSTYEKLLTFNYHFYPNFPDIKCCISHKVDTFRNHISCLNACDQSVTEDSAPSTAAEGYKGSSGQWSKSIGFL